jgi:DNA-binding response OmpR family regulator
MRRRAVIFDDDKFLRFYLWQFFDLRGYEVFTFPEPDLCPLHVVQGCPCCAGTCCADLIISDLGMMQKNGIDYIEALVKKGCKQRHFALMSGNFSQTDLVRAAQMGCALFSKPLQMEVLKSWVEAVEESIVPQRQLCALV